MRYTNRELRNKNFALLKRVQRQMDEPIIEKTKEKGFSLKSMGKKKFEDTSPVKKTKKNKRLNLLDRRNMFE